MNTENAKAILKGIAAVIATFLTTLLAGGLLAILICDAIHNWINRRVEIRLARIRGRKPNLRY